MRDGLPEIDLSEVTEVHRELPAIRPGDGDLRLGFAVAGVPHLVIACSTFSMGKS